MSYNVELKSYLPTVYDGIVEMETLQDSLSVEVQNFVNTCLLAMADQFIQTCSEKGIAYYEQIFKILAEPSIETLDFRKIRILNRLRATQPPYTYRYLKIMLDSLLSTEDYNVFVDVENRLLIIDSVVSSKSYYHEILVTLTNVKPCNLVFVYRPVLPQSLKISEEIKSTQLYLNYVLNGGWNVGEKSIAQCVNNCKLDGTWKLDGSLPISTYGIEEVRKMASIASVEGNLLNSLCVHSLEQIAKIVISDGTTTQEVTTFQKIQNNNVGKIEYTVANNWNLSYISSIQFKDSAGNNLTSANVYIPIQENVIIQHKLAIIEGV